MTDFERVKRIWVDILKANDLYEEDVYYFDNYFCCVCGNKAELECRDVSSIYNLATLCNGCAVGIGKEDKNEKV